MPAAPPAAANRWPGLFVVCIGAMMAFINVSSTISALTSIQNDLHVSGSTLVWVTSAFTLALVSLVMSAGTLGELYSRRLTYFAGAALFTAGSATALAAGSAGVLITGQAIMGAGAAAILPAGLATVNLFRQLGSMLGPAVLATIATSRFPSLLAGTLAADGVPRGQAAVVASSIGRGQAPAAGTATLRLLGHAAPESFATALHGGLLTGGIVLLVIAVLAAAFVRHRHPATAVRAPETAPAPAGNPS